MPSFVYQIKKSFSFLGTGYVGAFLYQVRKHAWSDETCYALRRDLRLPFTPPPAAIPITMRPFQSGDAQHFADSATCQAAEFARSFGARWAVMHVKASNLISLRGALSAGFHPYVLTKVTFRTFRRKVSVSSLGEDEVRRLEAWWKQSPLQENPHPLHILPVQPGRHSSNARTPETGRQAR